LEIKRGVDEVEGLKTVQDEAKAEERRQEGERLTTALDEIP
jgi:hypothetical protein